MVIEFRIARTFVSQIKMSMHEASSRVHIGKHLCNAFGVHIGLKQADALYPLIFNFSLEYAFRKVCKHWEGLALNGVSQLMQIFSSRPVKKFV
jgi:hypothetical protein